MRFLKNTKNLISFCAFGVVIFSLTSCVDTIPHRYRQGKELAKGQYYGFRANRYDDLEDSYIAAQSSCCGPDKLNDDVRALNLYCKAAQYGHKASLLEVGRIYSHQTSAVNGKGTVIPYDSAMAYAYFSLAAADGGYDYAASMKQDIEKKLTKEQLERANSLIAQFPNIPCELTR